MDADLEKIRAAWHAAVLADFRPDAPEADALLARQRPDGSWPDLVYTDQCRSGWLARDHVARLERLACAYADPGHIRADAPEVADALRRGVAFWCAGDYQSDNWWYNKIYVPRNLGHILLLAPDVFDAAAREAALVSMRRSEIGMTGQNRVWLARNEFTRALVESDAALVECALAAIFGEVAVADEEGVREDGCFHQHGPQIQWGNYGASFLNEITRFAETVAGTRFALTAEKTGVLRKLVLDGYRWVLWRGRLDYQTLGRQLGPDAPAARGRGVLRVIERMAAIDPARADDYRAMVEAHRRGEPDRVGTRSFWSSDFVAHRRPDFFATLRMNSTRTTPVEDWINYELALGRYFSEGVLLLSRHGDEYTDIPPLWDWARLPGATLAAVPHQPTLSEYGLPFPRLATSLPRRLRGTTDFVGAVDDGRRAAAVFTQDVDGVRARKAYFFGERAIICLGAGIESDRGEPVATVVNQTRARGGIRTGDGWIWHDGIGYAGQGLAARTESRRGDWNVVDGHHREPAPTEGDVFTVAIEHGVRPKDAGYAYALIPGLPADQSGAAALFPAEVLANTPALQAVRWPDGTVAAVFHQAGALGDFGTDAPGAFLLSPDGGVWAADPTQRRAAFVLTRAGVARTVELPKGRESGRSVQVI